MGCHCETYAGHDCQEAQSVQVEGPKKGCPVFMGIIVDCDRPLDPLVLKENPGALKDTRKENIFNVQR
jgi:hypothetical protein